MIGEGGMGQVWQATDTQLNREVALKILPDAFAKDPERLARFKREAQILASLNHPNIAAIYGIEEAEGTRALVLELVEGPTLADRIAHGALPIEDALPIARQIAEALEAAHEAGVIHRDLKPANIKVRDDGTVKVLDFGLAKALDPMPEGDPSQSPTLTAAATKMGVIMGTAAYMSPEQASGETTDKRSDIWSFGVVLFEMLTGRRLFEGKTVSHVLGAVLQVEPSWEMLPAPTRPSLRKLLGRCLEKDRRRRLRDIGDALVELDDIGFAPGAEAAEPAPARQALLTRYPASLAGVALLVGGVVAGTAVWSMRPAAPTRLERFVLTPPPGSPLQFGRSRNLVISADGSRIAYRTGPIAALGGALYVRSVGQLEPVRIASAEDVHAPFFSPDGEWIGFVDTGDGTMKRVSVLGGPSVTITPLEGALRGASWGRDDTIVFATGSSGGLLSVPAVGGEPERLTTTSGADGEIAHWYPEILPNGESVLFTAWTGSDETSQIGVLSLETGAMTTLVAGGIAPTYAASGHIVYGAVGTLRAVAFDPDRLEILGNPVPVAERVAMNPNFGAVQFSLADDGSLVYVDAPITTGAARTFVWVDRDGREEPVEGMSTGDYRNPHISPDGRRVVYDDGQDVFVYDLVRRTETRITTDPAVDAHPMWTPDGRQVVFSSRREADGEALFLRAADGTGTVQRLGFSEGVPVIVPLSWSSDGSRLLFHVRLRRATDGTDTGRDLGLLRIDDPEAPELLLQTEFNEGWGALSPNGRWVAYSTYRGAAAGEVFVERFPELGDRQQISVDPGDYPLWSPDGSELFYRSDGNTNQIWVVSIGSEDTLNPGVPQLLFERDTYMNQGGQRMFDISPSGDRFLIAAMTATGEESAGQIHLVQNWFNELERLVPVN